MVRSLFYVLILLLLYFIIQFIFFPNPPKLIAKQICLAPSGCKIEMETGFCSKCIELEETPIIKEEKVVVEKKTNSQNPPKEKNLHNLKCPKQKRKEKEIGLEHSSNVL